MTDATSVKFVELIFEPNIKNTLRNKPAYRSLAKNPHQLFTLFLQKDVSTEFFSAFTIYGKWLATLLSNIPTYFGQDSEHQLQLAKDGINQRLFEEMLGAFLFSLLQLAPADIASQETLADITLAVIKVSRPGGLLQLIGAELGDKPVILTRLIADGRIGIWSQEQSASFLSLTSDCWRSWATVAMHIVDDCGSHPGGFRWIETWETLKNLVESIPCKSCPPISTPRIDEAIPAPRANPRAIINTGRRAFDNLLGEHLGPWKIIISAFALKNFREAVIDGHLERIRERLIALAWGEWVRKSLRGPTPSSTEHRVPVYKASCQEYVILWQVDIAFDERNDSLMQVIKVWAICPTSEVTKMCEWIAYAQQTYSYARIALCQTKDLRKLKGAIFSKKVSASPETLRDGPPATPVKETTEFSPILGKFYSLTSIVLASVEHPTPAVFPVDPSEEEVHIINHVKSPAFILGRSGTGKTTCLIYKLASRYLTTKFEDETPVRQLLLTRSSDLAQKLKLYTKRLINSRLGNTEEDHPSGVVDSSEEDTTKDLLSLEDSDFPLVCTFSYFVRLLENAVKYITALAHTFLKLYTFLTNFNLTSRLHNIKNSRQEYWRRLPGILTRRIPADMAYVDIMGVIKGSASLDTNLEPLSRDVYTAKRWKLAPNFTKEIERNAVYSLYESYEKIKQKRGEIDDTDRVIRIFKSLRESPELQEDVVRLLHEIYVDAGDTAQSISKDSLFRFATAKALFYTRFSDSSIRGKQSGLVPELLPLSYNYRSHRGILSVASVVMELLYAGFPELVDKLPPEIIAKSSVVGSRLVTALNSAQEEQSSEDPTEETAKDEDLEVSSFGAERVILVRDEQTQHALQKEVKESAMVLTILQSKGMEFEDVFLYNFFSTSPYGSDFRVLEELLIRHHSSDPNETARSMEINITMCSELKHLYVAVTRARARLWIIENSDNVMRPIINLFNTVAPKLFQSRYPGALLRVIWDSDFTDIYQLQRQFVSSNKSTPSRWKELGYEFIEKKIYTQAVFCFKRAEDRVGETLANAYLAEHSALESKAAGSHNESFAAYSRACSLFIEAGQILKAVGCQKAMGNTVAAADILSENGRHEEAAWLYWEAEEPKKAAREYCEVGNHVKVLAACYHGSRYKNLIGYLEDCSSKINTNCRKQYSRLCYLKFVEKDIPELQMRVHSFLGSAAEQQSTFQEFGMLNDAFKLHKANGNFQSACEVAISIGLLEDTLSLVGNHVTLPDSVLANVFNHVQAKYILINENEPRRNQRGRRYYPQETNSVVPASLQQQWRSLVMALNAYKQKGNLPNRESIHDGILRGYFDLLVTKTTPDSIQSTDLTHVPLDFIGRAISILNTTIAKEFPPPEALLYLGIFRTPQRQYIALPWSPSGIEPKLGFPIQYMATKALYVQGSKLILAIIYDTMAFIDEKCRLPWQKRTKNDVFRGFEKGWTRDQFSASLQERRGKTVMEKWKFWQVALIRQMTFVSSYEQDASVLVETKNEMVSTVPELISRLHELLLSEVKSLEDTQPSTKFRLLSLTLRKRQEAEFLDCDAKWSWVMQPIVNTTRSKNLKEVYEVITLARTVRNTAPSDFPAPFLLLTLPLRFAVPRSWAALYLPKFLNVPRCEGSPETVWYQPFLVQIVSSLCELAIRIEETGFRKTAADEGLARRCFSIIAVGMINMRTLNPLPPDSYTLWNQARKVFSYSQQFKDVSPAGLPQHLINSFSFFEGKDEMKVVITEGYRGPSSFAGLTVQQPAIIEFKYRPAPSYHTLKKRRIIAAYTYIFTLRSPAIVEQMRRECLVLKEKHQVSIRLKEQKMREQQLKEQLMHQWLKEQRLMESIKDDYFKRFTY
ncbi:hypothetical protein BDD12DRAFT_981228 [Trichophaea hybrida]|nr:hypothetical protein BDD12DRAFT_981228 [Trichophaea hybrida]